MTGNVVSIDIFSPKNGEKVFILTKFRTSQTKILTTLDKVCRTRSKLFNISCKINGTCKYRIDRYGPMFLAQIYDGYPLRQSPRIPDFQSVLEQHNLYRSSASIITVYNGIDNSLGNRLNRQLITDIYLSRFSSFSNTSINAT